MLSIAQIHECARILSDNPLFSMLVRAALRARVSRMQPGETFQLEGHDIFVEDDEKSRSIVVQILLAEDRFVGIVKASAIQAGISEEDFKRSWKEILIAAEDELKRRHGIEVTIRRGMARIEASAYKIERWSWRDGPL